jgi:hypothetical protein
MRSDIRAAPFVNLPDTRWRVSRCLQLDQRSSKPRLARRNQKALERHLLFPSGRN